MENLLEPNTKMTKRAIFFKVFLQRSSDKMTAAVCRQKWKPDDGHIFSALTCEIDEKQLQILGFKVILWPKSLICNMFAI